MFSAEREFKISKRKKFNYLKAITEIWGGKQSNKRKGHQCPQLATPRLGGGQRMRCTKYKYKLL